jgi:hypothetical protein
MFLLDQWGRQVTEAFGDCPYLVGSVARAEPFRDVDVRMQLSGRLRQALADPPSRLRVVNLGLTLWGRQVTTLPIDFQFQPADEFHSYDGEVRNPLGGRSERGWRL